MNRCDSIQESFYTKDYLFHEVVDFEIEQRYKKQQFPDVTGLWRGDIILGCWRGQFATAKEVLDLYLKL